MASPKYITIKEAATLSGKSIQTIRRMIKSKKVKFKKEKTPQGFNYLIDSESLGLFFQDERGMDIQPEAEKVKDAMAEEARLHADEVAKIAKAAEAEKASVEPSKIEEEESGLMVPIDREHQKIVSYEPVKEFNDTMQKLISQHGKEKENLFKLVESFQNKVIFLENKLKEESASKKKWFKLW